jgi:hypothetical protein
MILKLGQKQWYVSVCVPPLLYNRILSDEKDSSFSLYSSHLSYVNTESLLYEEHRKSMAPELSADYT